MIAVDSLVTISNLTRVTGSEPTKIVKAKILWEGIIPEPHMYI